MIGRISGILIENKAPDLLVDVHGVGYDIKAPLSTAFALPHVGESVVLHTHLAVREDAHVLYGFNTQQERTLFRTLIKISGVGPKLALAILSGMETPRFIQCIQDQDPGGLVKIPGVGKKTAERLIVEMKDKLAALGSAGEALMTPLEAQVARVERHDALADAESALLALGYKPAQATKAVEKVALDGMSSEEIIRAALKAI
ncbi:Holliday junction branch migration protein RuvA [Reinekea marina]|uniref:Holliday junction branch migration complex subunit RuvA n=2 Tax=Reinekea marina TaxID=1310421 RepID=A0ABV7WRH9_9GAMM|nr:Holliday junction branch migration protein RuvA [Reinekea marina]MBU2863042.1 Holliday junction branch migration protein RuvA [Reinekea forsetii]MDN3650275.1 Holliday junction branch migration protein RuvA [Reinekea marina]